MTSQGTAQVRSREFFSPSVINAQRIDPRDHVSSQIAVAWHVGNMFLPLPLAYSMPLLSQKSSIDLHSAEKRLLEIWVVTLESPGAGAVVSHGVPPVPLAVGCYRVY